MSVIGYRNPCLRLKRNLNISMSPTRISSPPTLPAMDSVETQLLNKYNIPSLFPAQWPEEKDQSSDSDSDAPSQQPPTLQPMRRSKSRFSVLETGGSFSRKREGVEKTKDGVDNLVQKDEQDPLGTFPSVVQILRQRGLPVEDDVKLSMW